MGAAHDAAAPQGASPGKPNTRGARAHAHVRARERITGLFRKELATLPKRSRTLRRFETNLDALQALLDARDYRGFAAKADDVLIGEVAKLQAEDEEQGDHFAYATGAEVIKLAFQVAGIRLGLLKARNKPEGEPEEVPDA